MPTERIHIFYTDDDRDDIELFRDAVDKASKEIALSTQFEGGDLLQLLHNPPPKPAMVFLDWNMPGLNGAYVLKAIRQSMNTAEIPVIIFSTSSNQANIDEAKRLGANMYITKPESFSEMVKMIRYCLTIDWKDFSSEQHPFVYKVIQPSRI